MQIPTCGVSSDARESARVLPCSVGDVVNLNRFRKRKLREAEQQQAERQRVVHGQTKAEKGAAAAEREHADQALDGHERERPNADEPEADEPEQPDPDRLG